MRLPCGRVALIAMADEDRAARPPGATRADDRVSGLKARVGHWLDSDLVGIAVIVIVVSWVPMVLFAIRGWGKPPARLRGAGVKAIGRADIAHPMDSLMDGLREYPPNEVVMLPDRETNWESAARMAERIR